MKIKNKYNSQKAQEFFSQFSKENLLKIKSLADILNNELEITKKLTDEEREQLYSIDVDAGEIVKFYENSDYVLKPNFERTPINLSWDELEKFIRKLGDAFRFFDPTTPQYNPSRDDNYIGITSKENFDFFYHQLRNYVADMEKILYRLEYSSLVRNLIIHTSSNAYLLKKPDFQSENDIFMDFIIGKVNQRLTMKEIENQTKHKFNKTLHQIVNDLGFTSALREVFFPNISKNGIEFRNNITEEYLQHLYGVGTPYENKVEALDNQLKQLQSPK